MVRMGRHIPRKRRGIKIPNSVFRYGAKVLLHPSVKPFVARAVGSYDDYKRTQAMGARQRSHRDSDKIAYQRRVSEFYRNQKPKRKSPSLHPRLPRVPTVQSEQPVLKESNALPKRVVPGTARKRSAAPIGPYAGRFKRRRKSAAVRKPMQGNRDSVFGTLVGTSAVYSGFSSSGGRDYVIKQFCEQLIRQVCIERKVDISGRDAPLAWNKNGNAHITLLRLNHRIVGADGTLVDDFDDVSLTTTLTGNISTSFDETVFNAIPAVKDILSLQNRYIYGYELQGLGMPPQVVRSQVDTWRVSLSVYTSMKIQNITPADDAAGTKDDSAAYLKDSIMSNPLTGRSYEFSPGYPRMRPAVLSSAETSSLAILSKENGDHGFVQFPAASDAVYSHGNPLHIPPPGGTIFQNCTKGASMNLAPGNFKTLTSKFVFKGTVKQWCHKVNSGTFADDNTSSWSRFTLGTTIAFGLVPTMRTKTGEAVKLAYQYDIGSRSSLKPRYKCSVPRSNTSTKLDIGVAVMEP